MNPYMNLQVMMYVLRNSVRQYVTGRERQGMHDSLIWTANALEYLAFEGFGTYLQLSI